MKVECRNVSFLCTDDGEMEIRKAYVIEDTFTLDEGGGEWFFRSITDRTEDGAPIVDIDTTQRFEFSADIDGVDMEWFLKASVYEVLKVMANKKAR